MQPKDNVPGHRERNRRTKSFLKLHRPVFGEAAIEKEARMPVGRTRAYEWRCFKDESHQLTEECPKTGAFLTVELKVELLSDDGSKTTKLIPCCWNGRHFIYVPVFRSKVYRIFWRKRRISLEGEEQ